MVEIFSILEYSNLSKQRHLAFEIPKALPTTARTNERHFVFERFTISG